ncbi:transcription elongation GreA/GreB family factor [Bradyrhizobium sp. USDA 4520]
MMDKVPMTAGGYAALTDELKHRQSVDRPRIIEHIAEARSHGDLSENAEYHAAKEEQSHNEGRIAELEDKLARRRHHRHFETVRRHHQVRRDRDADR